MQLERDTISTFYDITKKEVKELELEIMEKDQEMECMEENHQIEIKVYIQKVKHLEYEHTTSSKSLDTGGVSARLLKNDEHRERIKLLRQAKRKHREEISSKSAQNAKEIKQARLV